jgi:uncharacterized surface protein with fasciclin (FAS1) repeats
MKSNSFTTQIIKRAIAGTLLIAVLVTSCKKNDALVQTESQAGNETELVNAARSLEQTAAQSAAKEATTLGLTDLEQSNRSGNRNIVEIAISNSNFSSLVAAVVKTGLAGALSDASANLTVFAPVNSAFAQLPAPFNNAANIAAINDPAQIDFLRNVLLYHVLGAEVFSQQISGGRSSATTIKPLGTSNDNSIYFSKTFGLIRVNGQSNVILANINASNGVIHVINKVLLFPTNNIAQVVIGNPNFSSLLAALVKTNLASVFTGEGNFTVFAPTNAAFGKLPAPFNNAANIANISDPAQVAALSNILRYHVTGSRYFAWDLGILSKIETLADAPSKKVTTILGYNTGWVKGKGNANFSSINPADVLTTNGVVHVIGDVLLP